MLYKFFLSLVTLWMVLSFSWYSHGDDLAGVLEIQEVEVNDEFDTFTTSDNGFLEVIVIK